MQHLFDDLLPRGQENAGGRSESLERLLEAHGFDRVQHEQIRADLHAGRIGLAQNRLPASTRIEDVWDRLPSLSSLPKAYRETGMDALAAGMVAVVSLSGGVGSRWTKGAATLGPRQ
jgi:hypothetical protein